MAKWFQQLYQERYINILNIYYRNCKNNFWEIDGLFVNLQKRENCLKFSLYMNKTSVSQDILTKETCDYIYLHKKYLSNIAFIWKWCGFS